MGENKTPTAAAIEKLQTEKKNAKNKYMAEPTIDRLIERVKESEALAQDVLQEHKTWERCEKYIRGNAREALHSQDGALPRSMVFEWAEDYFHADDKAEAKKEDKKKAEIEDKKKRQAAQKAPAPKAPKTEEKSTENEKNAQKAPENAQKQAESAQKAPKKSNEQLEGQMDLFSMFGM